MSICQDCGEPGTHWSCKLPKYVPSAWDLSWQERAEINAGYAEDYDNLTEEEKHLVDQDNNKFRKPIEMVREFHQKFGKTGRDPTFESNTLNHLRYDLIDEELAELDVALYNRDRVAVADALGDLLYVIYGAADVWDIDIDRVFAEIHRSNMTKEGGGFRSDGKILKGPNYSPPDLSFVLEGYSENDVPPGPGSSLDYDRAMP